MAWLVVLENGKEFICEDKPYKEKKKEYKHEDLGEQNYHGHFVLTLVPTGNYIESWNFLSVGSPCNHVEIPEGTIEKILGYKITPDCSPVKI